MLPHHFSHQSRLETPISNPSQLDSKSLAVLCILSWWVSSFLTVMKRNFFFPPLSEGRSTNKWEECVEILGLLPVKHEVCRDYFARLYSLCLDPLQALPLLHIFLALFLSSHPLICGFSRSCLFLSYYGLYFFPVSPNHSKMPSRSSRPCLYPLYPIHAMYVFLMEMALICTYSLLHTTAVLLTWGILWDFLCPVLIIESQKVLGRKGP